MDNEEISNEQHQNNQPIAPVQPPVPKGSNNQGGERPKTSLRVRQVEDAQTPFDAVLAKAKLQEPASYDYSSFNSRSGILKNTKYTTSVQDYFTKTGIPVRVPELGQHFVRLQEPVSFDGKWTNFGANYSWVDQDEGNVPALASTTMADPAYNSNWDTTNLKLVEATDVLECKWDKSVSTKLMTSISTNRWDWLTNGARQDRSGASATAVTLTSLFVNAIDINLGQLDTSDVAHWMYAQDVSSSDATSYGNLHIINENDLAAHYNHNINCSLPLKTMYLDLSDGNNGGLLMPDAVIGKMCLLDPINKVIINRGTKVTNNATYQGIPCRDVPAQAVNRLDPDVGMVLDQTYDYQNLEYALYLNSFWLPYADMSGAVLPGRLYVYRASFQDKIIRAKSRLDGCAGVLNRDSLNYVNKAQVFWTYRVLKTIMLQMALKTKGKTTGAPTAGTIGKQLNDASINHDFTGHWDIPSYVWNSNQLYHPVFIGWEFVKHNLIDPTAMPVGSKTVIAGERSIYSEYKWPSSYVSTDDKLSSTSMAMYSVNVTAAVFNYVFYSKYGRVSPLTVKSKFGDGDAVGFPNSYFTRNRQLDCRGYTAETNIRVNSDYEDVSF